jgi:hypothetical protein
VPPGSRCVLCLVALLAAAFSFNAGYTEVSRAPYDPGRHITEPTLFAPGRISTDLDESGGVFSPDGRDFYFTLSAPYTTAPRFAMICVSHFDNDWTSPQTLSFSGRSFDIAASERRWQQALLRLDPAHPTEPSPASAHLGFRTQCRRMDRTGAASGAHQSGRQQQPRSGPRGRRLALLRLRSQ